MAENPQTDRWAAGRLTPAQLDAVLARLEGLATPPALASAILELLNQCLQAAPAGRDRLQGEVIDLARCDPALTARLLSLASGSATPVTTAQKAIQCLGMHRLCGESLTLNVWPDDAPAPEDPLPRPQLHRHCLAVALSAEMIAPRLPQPLDGAEAFTCGLLHDLGKLALDCLLPKSFRRAVELAAAARGDLCSYERQVIGADHATVGRRLAELWRLPPLIIEIIWLHHQPPEAMPQAVANAVMIQVVALADALTRSLQLGSSGNYAPGPSCEQQAGRLGLAAGDLEDIRSRLPDELQPACELLEAGGPAARTRHSQSLRALAARMAKADSLLRCGEAEVALRAEAFAQLGGFAAMLSEQSTVIEALGGVARLAAKVTDLEASPQDPVVAYSLGHGEEPAQAVRYDGSEKPTWRALGAPADAAKRQTDPVALTAPAVAELLGAEEIGEWIDISTCRHLPLVCAGRWVGGVLLSPAAGTSQREQVLRSTAAAAAMALAIVQARCRAMLLSEQLAQASQALSAAQEALAEARTLAAIGEMAAGAAHELNNPLAVISGRAQLMREKAAGQEERRVWSTIAEQAQRISDIITGLMDFASPAPPAPGRIEVGELLKQAAAEFSASLHPQAAAARVDIEIGSDTPPAWADEAQIRAAVTEAISNAATAAGDRPHIRLAARAGDEEHSVLITVADDGPGMDAETLKKAFTPFFSAQRAGRRRGLGLPRARRYVESNAGRIWLTSRSGQGTCLHIQLPQA